MLLLAVTFASDFFCVSKAAAVTQSIITFVRYATVVARSLCWLVMFPTIQDSCLLTQSLCSLLMFHATQESSAAGSISVFVTYVTWYPRQLCC